jgi:NADH-quinone oxidoreductase subunit L
VQSREIIIALTFVLGAILTVIYLFRLFTLIFLGEPKGQLAAEKSPLMVGCVVLLAVLSLAGGLLVNYPIAYLSRIIIR